MAWLNMARLSFITPVFSADARGQFAAIARVRWRLFVNSLRSRTGRLELVSRIFIGLAFALGGLGGAVGLGAAAWTFVSQGSVEWLALLLWPVFLFWQLFPLMATTFTENLDSSNLLRFPLSYRSYFLIRLAYGSFDPATALGSLWLLGITLGIGFADRGLFLWAALVLLTFAIFNILLARMVADEVDRQPPVAGIAAGLPLGSRHVLEADEAGVVVEVKGARGADVTAHAQVVAGVRRQRHDVHHPDVAHDPRRHDERRDAEHHT